MPSMLLTVIGATGAQGGAVVEAALAAGNFNIRGITRNTTSAASQSLQSKGVDMVQADLVDFESIKSAFAGSDAIFGVTDFFQPFMAFGNDIAKAVELEKKHAINIITAAASTSTLKHFIWSTLPHASKISNGKYTIHHFLAKNFAEDYIEKQLPDLWAKTSFLWVGWYSSNVLYPINKPSAVENSTAHLQFTPAAADCPVNVIGNTKNIGPFVVATLQQPGKTLPGRYINAAVESASFGSLLDDWSKVSGKESLFVQVLPDAYDRLFPGWSAVEGPMFQYYDEYREKSWPLEGVLTDKDLGVDTSVMEGNIQTLGKLQL